MVIERKYVELSTLLVRDKDFEKIYEEESKKYDDYINGFLHSNEFLSNWGLPGAFIKTIEDYFDLADKEKPYISGYGNVNFNFSDINKIDIIDQNESEIHLLMKVAYPDGPTYNALYRVIKK